MNNLRYRFKAKLANGYWIHGDFDKNMLGNYGFQWSRFNIRQGSFADIIPETFCQCTGIRDSMGNPIYENDIIQRRDGGIVTGKYLVLYNPTSIDYNIKGQSKGDVSSLSFIPLWISHGVKCIVIGNKYDKENCDNESSTLF